MCERNYGLSPLTTEAVEVFVQEPLNLPKLEGFPFLEWGQEQLYQ